MRCALLSSALLVAAPAIAAEAPDPRVAGLVASVSEERLGHLVRSLEGFGTRHTLSATDTTGRGIGAARQWILEEMRRSSARLRVEFDAHAVLKQGERLTRDVELRNVVAVLPGRSPRRVYVTAHYDSVARPAGADRFDWSQADLPAPGANDDGSGTALVMELARAFGESGIDFDATLVFATFAGEEQGLVGATLHGKRAAAEGHRIDAVLNCDIVGNVAGGDGVSDASAVRVFSEGPEDSPSRQIARFVARQAAVYVPAHRVRLVARHDRFGRGGDHTPFNQLGIAGVRFSEARENYARQHTVADTADGVSPPYLARNARVVAAAAAVLVLAPPVPGVADERGRPLLDRGPTGYDARLRWTASPGATAYRVVWRPAWTPDWEHERAVGDATELVLPGVSIDDFVFGVAAVGAGGHESPVAAYVNPPRPPVDVLTKPTGP
ncbi:MAG: M20/M25/M40 family metallo-hydrolase [Acidobacteria bacterium]|nr:M20/M25/M40 family metallo-hydrolase [Acidobacteriota bacterium]